mmetsp:Transcript_6773/g.12053  ORF Transcript_6773/g.12053 Transcript_6773/m.12053 type:complete len:614 (-) Transcript_6773:286-2127(-)
MQYIIPKDDTSTLSLPERTFLRSAARGISSPHSSLLRLDGRSPPDSRPIRLSFARTHNRSECVVQFASQTRAAASVRAELVPPPNMDRPNDGQVKFNIDVGPMGCMGYEVMDRPVSNFGLSEAVDGGMAGSGGGGDVPYLQKLKSNRILRILERTLLIGGAMDAEALCVQSGMWVWRLHVDVSLLDDGGNAVDACVLAAVAALRHYRLPEVNIGGNGDGDGDDNVGDPGGDQYQQTTIIHSDDREPTPLPLHHTPLTATFALFADESGTTTSVSALLDPYDREELACDGLLTWSYNKYGEMCCLDFPGGCELRPRQLMASSKLGKRRCVEICELLERALEEAEDKAQKERMERLKAADANRFSSSSAMDAGRTAESSEMDVETTLPDDKEEEEYRLRALDYSSGHFAASVKEDKEKKTQANNTRGENNISSLFNAILRSAQSSGIDAVMDEKEAVKVVSDTVEAPTNTTPDVEIISKLTKSEVDEGEKSKEKKKLSPNKPAPAIESDEEEVVQLTTEFSAVPRTEREDSTSPTPSPQADAGTPMETEDSDAKIMKEEEPSQANNSGASAKTTENKSNSTKSKHKPVADDEEEVTDLSQALKKKKKKSKKPKKK